MPVDEAAFHVSREVPAFLPSAEETIFAIHSRPAGESRGTGFLHFQGRGTGGSWGRKRFTALLCRLLASQGFDALRVDYRGVGESTGTIGMMSTARPFAEDVHAGVQWLSTQGVGRIVLSGTCFGGRTVLSAAPDVEELSGIVLISTGLSDDVRQGLEAAIVMKRLLPWRKLRRIVRPRVFRGLFDKDRRREYVGYLRSVRRSLPVTVGARVKSRSGDYWVSPRYLEPMIDVVGRGVPVLLIFGEDDWAWEEYRRARPGRLGAVLDGAGDRVSVQVLPGRVHGAKTIEAERAVMEVISRWLSTLDGVDVSEGRPEMASDETGSS